MNRLTDLRPADLNDADLLAHILTYLGVPCHAGPCPAGEVPCQVRPGALTDNKQAFCYADASGDAWWVQTLDGNTDGAAYPTLEGVVERLTRHPLARVARLIYPESFPGEDLGPSLASLRGVDDCYVGVGGIGWVSFGPNRQQLGIEPGKYPAHDCAACGSTGLEPNGGGDACEDCTYWIDGKPCRTAEQAFAELVAQIGAIGPDWDERPGLRDVVDHFGFVRSDAPLAKEGF